MHFTFFFFFGADSTLKVKDVIGEFESGGRLAQHSSREVSYAEAPVKIPLMVYPCMFFHSEITYCNSTRQMLCKNTKRVILKGSKA